MPPGWAVALPITWPLPSVTVTSEPGSAVPVMGLPLVGFTVGAPGATLSTVTVASGPVLPDASVAVTCSTVPLGGTVAGTMV